MCNDNNENPRKFTADERDLISRLRDEASNVKDCFTKFAFQSIALSTAGLAIIAKYQKDEPFFGIMSVFVILIVLCIARIGTYKYASANRHYGYELYLDRLSRFNKDSKWKPSIKNIGWEEAIRAWRIVQATVFEYLYEHGRHTPNKLKRKHSNLVYRWFEPNSLIPKGNDQGNDEKKLRLTYFVKICLRTIQRIFFVNIGKGNEQEKTKVTYFGGSYLRTMQWIFFTIIIFSLISLVAVPVQCFLKYGDNYLYATYISGVIFVCILIATLQRMRQLDARRLLLEEGLLSIHSCAIMWNLVIIAHCRALDKLNADNNGQVASLKDYTKHLSELTIELTEKMNNIEDWVKPENDT